MIITFCRISKFRNFLNILKHAKRNSSALYITGDKAHETFAVVTPHIDFDKQLENKEKLVNNIKLREININLDEIIKIWNFYKHIEARKNSLEDSRKSISKMCENLGKKGDKYAEKIETLKVHGKMVKEDLKVLKESFYSIEEKAAIKVLTLPNELHTRTPEYKAEEIHSFSDYEQNEQKFHLDCATNLDLIEYNNPYNYYLKNDAALYELYSTFFASDFLLEKKFVQFSNSDFTRSVIAEGCGIDFCDKTKILTLNEPENEQKHENSRLHLTGGASLLAFMGFYCRHTIFPTQLPLKYFTVGRKYQPVSLEINSLLNVSQEMAVNVFIATLDDTEKMNQEFDQLLKNTIEFYEKLGYHFKICYLPAKQLHFWESLRASIQMFSPHLNEYIEVGNISMCGNFVSKRLLFNYGKGYDVHFPCVITGTLLNVPRILASVLECYNLKNKPLLLDVFKKYNM